MITELQTTGISLQEMISFIDVLLLILAISTTVMLAKILAGRINFTSRGIHVNNKDSLFTINYITVDELELIHAGLTLLQEDLHTDEGLFLDDIIKCRRIVNEIDKELINRKNFEYDTNRNYRAGHAIKADD